jgi:hypothetical protein
MSALAGQEKNEEDASREESTSADVVIRTFALASYSGLL